jgi:hypothetical protein
MLPAPDHNTASSKLRIFLILFSSLPFFKPVQPFNWNSHQQKQYEDRPKKVSLRKKKFKT